MKINHIFFIILTIITFHPSTSYSQNIFSSKKNSSSKIYYLKPDLKIPEKYKNTKCLNFFKKNTKLYIGLFCSSSDSNFLQDFGFDSSNLIFDQKLDSLEKDIKISTGYSFYEMHPIQINKNILYTATVDCDTENGAIYRANSTCHVGYMGKDGYFLYGNFVLGIETKNIRPILEKDIMNIWESADSFVQIKHQPIPSK